MKTPGFFYFFIFLLTTLGLRLRLSLSFALLTVLVRPFGVMYENTHFYACESPGQTSGCQPGDCRWPFNAMYGLTYSIHHPRGSEWLGVSANQRYLLTTMDMDQITLPLLSYRGTQLRTQSPPVHSPNSQLKPLLTLKVLYFWKLTSYCSLKPLWSGMGEVVPARTLPTLHPPSPPTVHQL